MERSIAGWRAAGRDIDASMSCSLRTQAGAVDLARAIGDPRLISIANRVLTEMLVRFGLVGGGQAADPFDAWVQKVMSEDAAQDRSKGRAKK
jgi:hypothetical protein